MLINLGEQLIKYNINPNGIIHVGAHWAEENDEYKSYGITHFIYIEPCKEAFAIMKEKVSFDNATEPYERNGILQYHFGAFSTETKVGRAWSLYNCACGIEEKEMIMYVSHDNQGQSNSLLEPHLHLDQHKEIVFNDAEVVKVVKLDTLMNEFSSLKIHNILAIDVQGFEGEVLKGAIETLKNIDVVYTEVNRGETYRNNALIEEIDELLSDFTRVETYWPSPSWTWGDAIFISNRLL